MESKRSVNELQKGYGHVDYEWMMLVYCINELLNKAGKDNYKNLLLEGFTIHTRCLYDFFLDEKSHKDDIALQDFIYSIDTRRKIRGCMKCALEPVKCRVNKEVAHLTYKRKTDGADDKAFEFCKIGKIILEAYQRFLNYLPDFVLDNELEEKRKGTEQSIVNLTNIINA